MKKIVIDGHNLIPKIPGIQLSDPDDEEKLLEKVGEYCRLTRTRAELFFDGAPPGTNSQSRHGMVNVHRVKLGTTADDAIIRYLQKEGHNTRNILVVSSDHRVQAESKALKSNVVASERFAQLMMQILSTPAVSESKRELPPSEEEVEEMLRLMTKNRGEK